MRPLLLVLLAAGCVSSPTKSDDTAAPVDTADTSVTGGNGGDSIPVDTSNADTDTDEPVDSGEPEETGDTSPPPPVGLTPVAPDADHFMWQGVQTAFLRTDGAACTGAVAAAVGEDAVCYVAPDGTARCAGGLYGRAATTAFADLGLASVTQLFLSPADGVNDGSSVCALASGALTCLGSYNDYGQFGAGSTGDLSSFVAASPGGLSALATGAWDQICGVRSDGGVYCSGYSFGSSLEAQGDGASVWVETSGGVHVDESTVWRASPARTVARLGSRGLDCDSVTCRYGALDGATGLVDVVVKQRFPDGGKSSYPDEVCELSSAGGVACTHLNPADGLPITETRFGGLRVLLLAASDSTSTLCAVADDGSLWCLGANEHGQLGTGDTAYVAEERQVVAAGGVRVDCR